jgi:hypothetical protein
MIAPFSGKVNENGESFAGPRLTMCRWGDIIDKLKEKLVFSSGGSIDSISIEKETVA